MRTPVETHHEPPLAELLRRIDGQLLPHPWRQLGCGNDAAVLHHPDHPGLVVKVHAPGRPGLVQEAEVYRRIGCHPAFSQCFHRDDGYLVLRRLDGVTLWDCLLRGIPMPSAAGCMATTCMAAIRWSTRAGAWQDLRWAYHWPYRPVIAPLGLRAPAPLLDGLRKGYRLYRRLVPATLQAP